ncbi:DNA cytosine methyltransferase [Kribbella sp. VKM Ac-2566]|uniref:DNA cytosine methyltransferase n=1 Tax=Kribbella sp. VKM Ac-2566 TaxID=2512218 RepID=UPI001EE0FF8C|nr:DNA (cytosine-5-)-methyltransferase [Kribbella sp. VKM Ac-2566]
MSLCAGIGGIDLGFHRAGIPTTAAVELDPRARGVLTDRFPETHLFEDLTEVSADDLRSVGVVPDRTVLAAGWPCQGNSSRGRRGGLADPRSGLWVHVARLLGELRPRWFVGENVPGLLSVNDGRDFGTVLADLAELGMDSAWRVLDGRGFGVPQRRRRLVLVGHSGDRTAPVRVLLEPDRLPGHPHPHSEATPQPSAGAPYGARDSRSDSDNTADRSGLTTWAPAYAHSLVSHGGNDKQDPSMVTYVVQPNTGPRRLTPLESERLQGFPDGWTATSHGVPQSDRDRYAQLGNSVAVPVFEWVARRVSAVHQTNAGAGVKA